MNFIGNSGSAESVTKNITLASCSSGKAATLTGTIFSECTGILNATPSSRLTTAAGAKAITYNYTYFASSGSGTRIEIIG